MNSLPKEKAKVSISAVDLFCGVGGLTHGLRQVGINVIAGIDVDPTCRYAYEKNNGAQFIEKDIREFKGAELSELYPSDSIKFLVGCAPCQPFSVLPKNRSQPPHADEKWGLLNEFARLVAEVRPEIVAFENITPIRKKNVFTNFVETLDSLDYEIWKDLLYCPDYGVPQKRRRLILIASRLGVVESPPKTHAISRQEGLAPYLTVWETIGHLSEIEAGQECTRDRIHQARNLSDKNKKRIKQSKPGGTWEDWDKHLLCPCHRKLSGQTYKSVYGRMKWDEPAPTITTQFHNFGSGRFGHPEQDRALSIREGALLQTFPEEYDFVEPDVPVIMTRLGVHIGNAVPVKLATVIGQHIQNHVGDRTDGQS